MIESSRFKTGLGFAASLIVLPLGLAVLLAPDAPPRMAAAVMMVLGGIGIILFGWQTAQPSRLEIGPSGFTHTAFGKSRLVRWDQAANFDTWAVSLLLLLVRYDFTPDNPGAKPRLALLPAGWRLGPRRLSALLNESRARWTGR